MRDAPDAQRLRRLSRLLEEALALPAGERDTWLRTLPPHEQGLAPQLSALLARAAVETDTFMRRPLALDSVDLDEDLDRYLDDADESDGAGDAAGDTVGPYRLIRAIGKGGMATVWLAERADAAPQRQVALKLPRQGWAPGLVQRMARERDILASLEHPNIARLYDAGSTGAGRPYLAMEYVEGRPLDVHARERGLALRDRLQLFLQVARAVAHAHAHLVVHRDLKPSNILVAGDGAVRLLDFGVAKLLEGETTRETRLTQLAGRAFTPDYASPEQIRGEPLGVASDVYSLGVVLYELVTGQRPYKLRRESAAALEEAITEAEVPPASSRLGADRHGARALRGDVDTILAKALKKNVHERYASVESFAADVQRHLDGEAVLARPDSRWYRAGKFARRHRLPLGAAAAVALALLGGIAAATWQAREALRQAAIARASQKQSQASTDFVGMVLSEGLRPDETLTLDALLKRSEAMAGSDFAGTPLERAVAADTVAGLLVDGGHLERAEQLLTRTLDALPKDIDPTLLHNLRCERAVARADLGQTDAALAELDQVIAAAAGDPQSSWYCLQRRTTLALRLNDAQGAQRFAQEALRQFDRSGTDSDLRRALLVANEAYAAMLGARPMQADARYRESVRLLEAAGRAEGSQAVGIYGDWAIALWSAGDPRAALAQLDRAMQIAKRRAPDGEAPASLHANRAHALRALGRYDEAMDDFEHVQRLAQHESNPSYEVYALAGQAIVALRRGQPALARERVEAGAQRLAQAALPPEAAPALWLKIAQALLWQAQGHLAEADQALADVQAQYARRQAKTGVVAETAVARTEIAIALGRFDAAAAHAEQALAIARTTQGDLAHSLLTGIAWLALAQTQRALGRAGAAHDAAAQALAHLLATAGEAHPAVPQARELMAVAG